MDFQITNFTTLSRLTSDYIRELFYNKLQAYRYFHNLKHAVSVVEKCKAMIDHYNLSTPDAQKLILAAWFHDTGYVHGSAGHEEYSVKIARSFLRNFIQDDTFLNDLEKMILGTKLPVYPVSLSQEILCDADLYHLGSDAFSSQTSFLKNEISAEKGISISDEAWRLENIAFLSKHRYFTSYARTHWNEQKEINLTLLKHRIDPAT